MIRKVLAGFSHSTQEYLAFFKSHLKRSEQKAAFVLGVLTVCTRACLIGIPILIRSAFYQVDAGSALNSTIGSLLIFIGVYLVISLLRSSFSAKLNISIQKSLQLDILTNGIQYHHESIEARGAGAFISTVYGDCEQISQIICNMPVSSTLLDLLQITVIVCIASSWSSIFLFTVLPLYLLLIFVLSVSQRASKHEFSLFRGSLNTVNPKVMEYLKNRITLLGSVHFKTVLRSIQTLFLERDVHLQKYRVIKDGNDTVITCFSLVSKVMLLCSFAYAMTKQQLGVGDMVALLTYIDMAFTPVLNIKKRRDELNEFTIRFQRIQKILHSSKPSQIPLLTSGTYQFKNASLSYEDNGRRRYVFQNYSYTFHGVTGIVGFSGTGKSSIVKTLLGNFVFDGICRFGSIPIQHLSDANLLSVINYYPQNPEIFDDDLHFNITLGKKPLPAKAYQEAVDQKAASIIAASQNTSAAKALANEISECMLLTNPDCEALAETVRSLYLDPEKANFLAQLLMEKQYYEEEKYETLVQQLGLEKLGTRRLGSEGRSISGGEKAKVALARFLLRGHSAFFILDEPFTNIDILSLEHCMAVFQQFCRHQNGIIISHDLSVIKRLCDSVLVLEPDGNPLTGTFEDLLLHSKIFRALYDEFVVFHRETPADLA